MEDSFKSWTNETMPALLLHHCDCNAEHNRTAGWKLRLSNVTHNETFGPVMQPAMCDWPIDPITYALMRQQDFGPLFYGKLMAVDFKTAKTANSSLNLSRWLLRRLWLCQHLHLGLRLQPSQHLHWRRLHWMHSLPALAGHALAPQTPVGRSCTGLAGR